jgi:hypothetical protein
MNKDRRKSIDALIKDAEKRKTEYTKVLEAFDAFEVLFTQFKDGISDFKDEIEAVRDEEQEYIDNMPESLQQSDRAQTAEAAVQALDAAMEALDAIVDFDLPSELPGDDAFDDAISNLDEAKA